MRFLGMDLFLISKHRTALMGIAAIMILLCHSAPRISMPPAIAYPLSFLNIGVDIFLFLSGMGIYYSLYYLEQTGHGGVMYWYSKRYIRILIPYFFIVIPFCGISMLIEGSEWKEIIMYTSTLSFWTDHTGFWYIALILPLYLVSPLLYRFFENKGIIKLLIVFIGCIIIALIPVKNSGLSSTIFVNIQFAIVRVPSYLFGMVLAPRIINGGKISFAGLVFMCFAALISLFFTKHLVFTYALMVLPILILLVNILDKLGGSKSYSICNFFGQISLESYLFNGAIQIYIIWLMSFLGLPDYNNIVMYTLVVSVGTVLAVVVNRISRKIKGSKSLSNRRFSEILNK